MGKEINFLEGGPGKDVECWLDWEELQGIWNCEHTEKERTDYHQLFKCRVLEKVY